MEELNSEHIQQRLENNDQPATPTPEEQAYIHLFRLLDTQPQQPANQMLTNSIMEVVLQKAAKNKRKKQLIYLTGITTLLLFFIAGLIRISSQYQLLQVSYGQKMIFAACLLILVFFSEALLKPGPPKTSR